MIKNNKKYAIGIDVGGTKIAALLFGGEPGKMKKIADYTLGTPRDNYEHFFIMLLSVIEPLLDRAKKEKLKVEGIGLGIAAMVDKNKGAVLKATNIPYLANVKIKEQLEMKTGLPVNLENDAACFLRGEMRFWAEKKYKNVYGLTIGTGIGGSWWNNGDIYQGAHGATGEPGYMVIDCGEMIDLERIYKKLTQHNASQLAEEAYTGDILAQKAFEEFGRYLGLALANIGNLLDPEVIILGGGVVESSDLFLSSVSKTMDEHLLPPSLKEIRILKGKLSREAGAIGAAYLML